MSNPDSDPSADQSAASFTEGQKLAGCYVLGRRLTTGDDTEVWFANDEVLGKDVCLHFVPEAARKDTQTLPELRKEVKRNRQLIHPNILRVYDLVEEPEWAAISTDAFEGESLAVLLAKQKGHHFTAAPIQPWVGQLAQTIEEAHKINVLHRDLVPANLFLTPAGKLLVVNFGLSRVIQDALGRAGKGAASHAAFASPQALEGETPARTDDVYGLGALLYTLLVGKPPAASADEARAGVTADALAALQKPDLAIPPAWQKTIAACLEKNPAARPQSAAEAARHLTGEAPAPAPAAPPARTERPAPAPEPAVTRPQPEHAGSLGKREPEKREPEPGKSLSTTAPKPPAERKPPSDFAPRMYPEESRFPTRTLAIAAGLIILIAIIYQASRREAPSPDPAIANSSPERAELRTLNNATPPVSGETTAPAPAATPAVVTSTSTPTVETSLSATPAPSGAEKAMAEKASALETVRQAAEAAEKAHAELVKQQQQAEAAVADAQKLIDEKAKGAEAVKKAADEAATQRKKLEADQAAAEAAAAEAQKVAADKMRVAEEAKKAIAEADKKNQEKMAAQQKADAELTELKKMLAEKQRAAELAMQAASGAEAARQQQMATIAAREQEIAATKAAAAEDQRKREAAEAERMRVDQELEDMKKMFADKMKELENKRKALENPTNVPGDVMPVATPGPAITPRAVLPTTPLPMGPGPEPSARLTTPEPMKVAALTTPPPGSLATPAPAVVGGNSLGLKFVPVGDVDFCIWQTRVRDFEIFAKAVNLKSTSWKGPGFRQGPDHPVVNVTWQEAIAFCKWLSDKEHKEGTLPANQFYRLPTDLEWSKAVGLAEEAGKTPEARDMGIQDVYPWGKVWPPPPGSGNYTGEETGSDVAIKGYDDGFAWTSPVGSFPPNQLGLYDMGGNVWQWCMDGWNDTSKAKVLRGASWYNGALKLSLLSSCRVHAAPDSSTDNYGFRLVRANETAKPARK